MTDVQLSIRDPWYPHATLSTPGFSGLSYGFMLHRPAGASFNISRSQDDAAGHIRLGMFMTLDRSDGLLPWAGYISQRVMDARGSQVQFQAKDIPGALFSKAVEPSSWSEQTGLTAASMIDLILNYARQRGDPPLQLEFSGQDGGPTIEYTPRAQTVLSFLSTMEKWTGWEWDVVTRIDDLRARPVLTWQHRVGRDLSHDFWIEDGVHVKDLRLTQDAEGWLTSAIAIAGTGPLAQRETVTTTREGFRTEDAVDVGDAKVLLTPTDSPALMGTRVIVDDQVGPASLGAAAARVLDAPEFIRESLEFTLVESTVQMDKIELGNLISIRFADMGFGLGVERVVRIVAMSMGVDGEIRVVAEVQRERRPEDTQDAQNA